MSLPGTEPTACTLQMDPPYPSMAPRGSTSQAQRKSSFQPRNRKAELGRNNHQTVKEGKFWRGILEISLQTKIPKHRKKD